MKLEAAPHKSSNPAFPGPPAENTQQIDSDIKKSNADKVYVRLVGEGGFEPPKSVTTDLQSAPFGRSGIPPYKIVELVDGFEPPTC